MRCKAPLNERMETDWCAQQTSAPDIHRGKRQTDEPVKVYPQQLMQPGILLHTGYHTDLTFLNALLTASTPFVQKPILINDGLLAAVSQNAAIEAQRCETFQDLIQLVAKQSISLVMTFLLSYPPIFLLPYLLLKTCFFSRS